MSPPPLSETVLVFDSTWRIEMSMTDGRISGNSASTNGFAARNSLLAVTWMSAGFQPSWQGWVQKSAPKPSKPGRWSWNSPPSSPLGFESSRMSDGCIDSHSTLSPGMRVVT